MLIFGQGCRTPLNSLAATHQLCIIMPCIRNPNRKLPDYAKLVLKMYRQINLFINNAPVIHDKTKSRIICFGRNQAHLSNNQFLLKRAKQKLQGQTIIKSMAKLEIKKLKMGLCIILPGRGT